MKTIFLMIARVLYDKGYQEYVDSAKIIVQEYQNVENIRIMCLNK